MSGHGGSRKKHKGGHEEEHESHERWLVTYADMLTLLMVLFVVLFAMSSIDKQKFEQLSAGLKAGFGAATAFDGGTGALLDNGQANSAMDAMNPPNVAPDIPAPATSAAVKKAVSKALAAASLVQAQASLSMAQSEVNKFKKLQAKINKALADKKIKIGVRFTIDERGLVITIITSSVVFPGDRADLLPFGQNLLDAIGPTLKPLPNKIEVDGHTNQLPVPTRYYPTAWELSSARATIVVRYLIDREGLPSDRMLAVGFAGTRPLYKSSDPRAVTLNRRVEIVVLTTLTPAQRALLPIAAAS